MLSPTNTLPFARQLLEQDGNEVAKWFETLPVSPSKKVIRELQKRAVKNRIHTWNETMMEVVDEVLSNVSARLEKLPPDVLLDEDNTLIDALQDIECSFMTLYDYFNDEKIRAEYGIRWTNSLIKQFHNYAEKTNDLIWKISIHDGTVAADAVEDKTPVNAAEIISELGLSHVRSK